MVRLKTRWKQKDRARHSSAVGSVLAMSAWKLAVESLLNLESEGFETRTNSQRLDVIGEFLAYCVHLIDRLVHERLDDRKRGQLLAAVAARGVGIMSENRRDAGEEPDDGQRLVDLINRRSDEYAECGFDAAEGPGFTMRRILGGHVQHAMGKKDGKWIPDYVLDAEAPEIFRGLRRAVRSVL